jgi:hypothetical protein
MDNFLLLIGRILIVDLKVFPGEHFLNILGIRMTVFLDIKLARDLILIVFESLAEVAAQQVCLLKLFLVSAAFIVVGKDGILEAFRCSFDNILSLLDQAEDLMEFLGFTLVLEVEQFLLHGIIGVLYSLFVPHVIEFLSEVVFIDCKTLKEPWVDEFAEILVEFQGPLQGLQVIEGSRALEEHDILSGVDAVCLI